MNSNFKVDSKNYRVETWLHFIFDTKQYLIGIQVWEMGGRELPPIECKVSREFIEDEIDNKLSEGYLEQLISRMTATHIKEIVSKGEKTDSKVRSWLKQAKRELNN